MGIEEERQAFLRELSITINDLKNIMSNQIQHDITLLNHLLFVNSAIEENDKHLKQKLLLYKSQVSYLIEILEGREGEVNDYIQKLRNPNYSINFKEEVDG
ncbi:MAG: hypothetical protein sL5_06790 [Candidatus Mesenet longicola]|uniref:Uncharacterized protein n=1 Tax=Candidatus Mesenet longicola TaxID=1892558 RepID=A0A8J3HY42_9RICK|nr:MAG: hypothetical protein sGL2_07160 [Candidatus Mesenet longicola]GHM59686.1 MAG: hypothetical protein sL5_06790 [Candidatus Mesenet longicola]